PLLDARTSDAVDLAGELRPLLDANGQLGSLPARLALGGADADAAMKMLAKWLAWLDAMLYEGDAANPSWQRNRMEYAFALKAGDAQLDADEYTDGHVDWEDFRATAAAPAGAVREETLLARDEMANRAWAIEHTVQGVSGEPLDRDLEAHARAFQQKIDFDGGIDSPQLVYRLQTPVPANWTPLLPVRDTPIDFNDPLTIRLARAGMKRFYPEASVEVIGAVDPAYVDFLALLDAQTDFVTRV